MCLHTHDQQTMVTETGTTTNFRPRFFYDTFVYCNPTHHYVVLLTRLLKDGNKTTTLLAHFVYNMILN